MTRTKTNDVEITSPLLSMREAAGYLKIGTATLYERLAELETVKLGRRHFVLRASADEYIRRNSRPPRVATKRRRAA